MWQTCNPRNDKDLATCARLGDSLSRFTQPTILTILAAESKPQHGYALLQKCAATPMYGGHAPNATGIYRTIKVLEHDGYIKSSWLESNKGNSKGSSIKVFSITAAGKAVLRRWIDAMACYAETIQDVRLEAAQSLGIDLPPTPSCHN